MACGFVLVLAAMVIFLESPCLLVEVSKYEKKNRPSTLRLEPYLIEKYANVRTNIQCAAKCSYTSGCISYLYGKAYPPDECYKTSSHRQWTGRWNTTETGKPCQSFAVQWPYEHLYTNDSMYPDGTVVAAGNACRDPGNDGFFWCYTLDPLVRWEKCDIGPCTDDNCFLYSMFEPSFVDLGIYKYYQRMP